MWVEESGIIDDMESDLGWTFSPAVQLIYTEESARRQARRAGKRGRKDK